MFWLKLLFWIHVVIERSFGVYFSASEKSVSVTFAFIFLLPFIFKGVDIMWKVQLISFKGNLKVICDIPKPVHNEALYIKLELK